MTEVVPPACDTCGMRHRALIIAFPDAKPDPRDCIKALSEMIVGLTMAMAGKFGPLNVACAKYYPGTPEGPKT